MNPELSLLETFLHGEKYYLPSVAANNVIFGFNDDQMKVLLLKITATEKWTLPGGFILKDEELIVAAERILKTATGLESVFLQQFGVFGGVDRAKEEMKTLPDQLKNVKISEDSFLLQRFVVIGYLALVKYHLVTPKCDEVTQCEWFDLNNLPPLTFDHNLIVENALKVLRFQLSYLPIGYNLLPEEFPLKSLQLIYETILGRKLDRGNFNKKILSYGILEKKEKFYGGGAHKAPYLYSFKKEIYFNALENGLSKDF